jgi:hypothetical protein
MSDTYKPTESMASAANRAIKWKQDGKATGAGTPVGWRRASQLSSRQPLTLDTVKRMYSFFSRHEVDKKGEGFSSGPKFPSNGRIMWDAWGGDAGFSWSRAIVNREKKKSASKASSPSVGSMVSWNSSGGKAEGKITRIVRNGKINVPNSSFTITGTPEDPAALIRLYKDGKPTDTYVGHKLSTLNSVSKNYEIDDSDEFPEDDYANLTESELLNEDKIEKSDEWHGEDLYNQLSSDEKAFADSLLKLTNDIGPLDKSSGIWIGYQGGSENENLSIGVKCGNCVLHKNEMNCLILSQQIELNGICRLAVIPDSYVNSSGEPEMEKSFWGGFFKAN